MGYYTEFELGIHCDINNELLGDSRKKQIVEFLSSLTSQDENYDYLSSFADTVKEYPGMNEWSASDNMKWYEHEEDLKSLSLKFADVVFVLSGKGEEDGDVWKKYFLNGRMQECPAKITVEYDEFNPSELK